MILNPESLLNLSFPNPKGTVNNFDEVNSHPTSLKLSELALTKQFELIS